MSRPADSFEAFVARYVAVWNEPDTAERRRLIETLWHCEGANFTRKQEWRGYDELEARVRGAHEKWVRDEHCRFRPRHADTHHGAMRLAWEMAAADGRVVSVGNEFLLLTPDGRIRDDFQFPEA